MGRWRQAQIFLESFITLSFKFPVMVSSQLPPVLGFDDCTSVSQPMYLVSPHRQAQPLTPIPGFDDCTSVNQVMYLVPSPPIYAPSTASVSK